MYEKIFETIAKFFNLKTKIKLLTKPNVIDDWVYSKYGDSVYELYVTNGSFGFWIHDAKKENVYKEGITKVCSSLKWYYKVKLKEWLKLK